MNIDIPQFYADGVLATLVVSTLSVKTRPREVAEVDIKWDRKDIGISIAIFLGGLLFASAVYSVGVNDSSVLWLLFILCFGPLTAWASTRQFGAPARRVFLATLALYLAIAVIAAISEGLSRPIE